MANRLQTETSPYLLQHAHNPVDWYPWGGEALARARDEDRPILLSVGYSACHWCHVMERESFEDPETAALMNRHLVCVKVDREERPDIDDIYMKAVQSFSGGRGGWPMTVFLTPSGLPFLGGTYFPPTPRHGMPSFAQVIEHAVHLYGERRADMERTGRDLAARIGATSRLPLPEPALSAGWLHRLEEQCDDGYDDHHGGFGWAPKFPPSATLAALLCHHHRTGSARALEMVTGTLDGMSRGAMHDLVGGGFARYSVDEKWLIPHFEKMLYDNAQLAPLYADAARVTGRDDYAWVATRTLDWVLREMTAPEGGFRASLDADSEGQEGRFYCWTPAELTEALGPDDGARAAARLGVTEAGNFEHGLSALRLAAPWGQLSEATRSDLSGIFDRLLAARSARVRPGRDDKIITAWNGLAISAMARVGAALNAPRFVAAAVRAADFLRDALFVDGRLQRTWKDGRAHVPGYLDDHAFLIQAAVDLFQATFEPRWLTWALELVQTTRDLFFDPAAGFFYTGQDAERLVVRPQQAFGGAEPTGHGVLAHALLQLEALTGRSELGDVAEGILRAVQPLVGDAARALGPELIAGAWRAGECMEIGVVGAADAPETEALLREVRQRHLPFAVVARLDPGAQRDLLPWMAGRGLIAGRPSAWVCRGRTCRMPVTHPSDLGESLDEEAEPGPPELPDRPLAPALPRDPERWVNLDALRSHVVVLDFWTSTSVNCAHLAAELDAVEARFDDMAVAFVGVHAPRFPGEASREVVAGAAERAGRRHPVLLDTDHALWKALDVRAGPTVVIMGARGCVAWRNSGETSREAIGKVLWRLVGEARTAGLLAAARWRPPRTLPEPTPLRSPGTVAYHGLGLPRTGQADGRLYVADTGHHRILECALQAEDGVLTARLLRTFGDGRPGAGDGPTPRFRRPQGIVRQGDTLFVADTGNHLLRAIDLASGVVTTLAGTGALGTPSARHRPDRPRECALRSPWDVAATEEAVLIAMAGAHQIWVYLRHEDRVGAMAGTGAEGLADGPLSEAELAQPSGLALVGEHLLVVDAESSALRAVHLRERRVRTVVGAGLLAFGHEDGPAATARLQPPRGVASWGHEVLVADSLNHAIRRIDPEARTVGTIATGAEALREPGGLCSAGAFVVVADTANHRLRVLDPARERLEDLPIGGLRAP